MSHIDDCWRCQDGEPCKEATVNGVERIAAERARQQGELGYTTAHDSEHADRELLNAAIFYAARECDSSEVEDAATGIAPAWSFTSLGDEALVKAGALLAAEIDRRAALAEVSDG